MAISKVSDEDLHVLIVDVGRNGCGVSKANRELVVAAVTELRALREVAEAAELYCVAHSAGDCPSAQCMNLQKALAKAGL